MREEGNAVTTQGPNDNRTVFRPSPLSGAQTPGQAGQPQQPLSAPPAPWGGPPLRPVGPNNLLATPGPPEWSREPPPTAPLAPPPEAARLVSASTAFNDEDIPVPSRPRDTESPLVIEAAPVLALAASIRSGRARIAMPDFHRRATEAVAAYDRAIAPLYPEESRMRARYALCATIDDIAQNLPGAGSDGVEWARRSLVVQFFRENIGGDRFWQLVEDLLNRPGQNSELIELFADCLAAGFEGRFRVMPDGRARLQQVLANLYGALEHPRTLSSSELSPRWRGEDAPLQKMSPWNRLALVAAAATAGLLLVYVIFQFLLITAGADSYKAVTKLTPSRPLGLSRLGAAPPPAAESGQLQRLRQFLAPEIRQRQVVVEEDGTTVRVRTTVGQLFQSGSDQLEGGRSQLFERIGRAVEGEPAQVTVEGYSDSDRISGTLEFPDNTALSAARAQVVANVIGSVLSNSGRISVKGFGEQRPVASNLTREGKALNRRVEIVIPRQS